jgi:choline-glycine betaine transporter
VESVGGVEPADELGSVIDSEAACGVPDAGLDAGAVSEVEVELVTVVTAAPGAEVLAAVPIGVPVIVCVTPLESTEMVTGMTTRAGEVGDGDGRAWVGIDVPWSSRLSMRDSKEVSDLDDTP